MLDPFAGSCTVGMAAARAGVRFWGIDASPQYLRLALESRLRHDVLDPTVLGTGRPDRAAATVGQAGGAW